MTCMKIVDGDGFPLTASTDPNSLITEVIDPKAIFHSSWNGFFDIN
jgi:hypothetical protein